MTFVETLQYRNAPLFYFGFVCLLLALFFLLLTKISAKQFKGVSTWNKPFKFAFSIMLYAWSMAWYCYHLPSFNIGLFNWSVIGLLGFEIVYIAIQAARAQASHYNTSSPFYAAMYRLMGLAAALVTLYTAYVAVLYLNTRFTALPLAYTWAIRLGLVIFVVFSFEGAAMGARMAHTVGGKDGGPGIPLFTWSTRFGDLRVAHFIGMHALQVLPLLAYYSIKSTKAIFVVSALYALLALYTLIKALNGRAFYK